jgi:hypothetical protein
MARLSAAGVGMSGANLFVGCTRLLGQRGIRMENESLHLDFDRDSGLLKKIVNKLTLEEMEVQGNDFAVVAEGFTLTPKNTRLEFLEKKSAELVEVTYRAGERSVVAAYKLGARNQFFEKCLTVTSSSSYRLKTLVVSKLGFSGTALRFFRYPYQKNVTYFGRAERGGVFLGLELPFDASYLDEDEVVTLAYHPSLKVNADEHLTSEPMYFGAYKRGPGDLDESDLPLQSESEAMVHMTSTIIGPPRHGLVPMACGWHCEMEHSTYRTEAQVEADMRSIDFLAECGVDWVSDSHPWSGETEKMNALRQGDHYEVGPLVKKFLEYAREKKVNVIFWPTMNTTGFSWSAGARPFRPDRPDWLMFVSARGESLGKEFRSGNFYTETDNGNCIANEPFFEWLMGVQLDAMRTGCFSGWVMDGDFFGGGGMVLPVNCPSFGHDHLPGDSNYACERALTRMISRVLREFPRTYIGPMCRPSMDLGIWSNRLADAVFTLDEFGSPEPLAGLSNQPLNVVMGDKARRWSRLRVHRHFFPHYVDQPPTFAPAKSDEGQDWQSEKIDYVMLSALSSSPTQLYYLPTKAGIPAKDKAEIRKWLDWGRKNIRYLQVRKDLPQWPEAGKVDGNAHILEDRGMIFLFNPNPTPLPGRFRLDRDSLGITRGTRFEVGQSYPASETKQHLNIGEDVVWQVPPQSSVVLSIAPMTSS